MIKQPEIQSTDIYTRYTALTNDIKFQMKEAQDTAIPLRDALDNARANLATLEQEASVLPESIKASASEVLSTGDTVPLRDLKARQNDMALLLAGARVAVLQAEIELNNHLAQASLQAAREGRHAVNSIHDVARKLVDRAADDCVHIVSAADVQARALIDATRLLNEKLQKELTNVSRSA